MQDRFKFRLFNKAAKKFIYFDKAELLVDRENMGLLYRCDHLYLGNYEELQYCTGLKDKNGKLIYEGDCIKNLKTNTIYKVFWEQQATCFMLKSIKFGGVVSTYMMFEEYPNDLTKISNIYESPELLESN